VTFFGGRGVKKRTIESGLKVDYKVIGKRKLQLEGKQSQLLTSKKLENKTKSGLQEIKRSKANLKVRLINWRVCLMSDHNSCV
jgi:hypothetical protein